LARLRIERRRLMEERPDIVTTRGMVPVTRHASAPDPRREAAEALLGDLASAVMPAPEAAMPPAWLRLQELVAEEAAATHALDLLREPIRRARRRALGALADLANPEFCSAAVAYAHAARALTTAAVHLAAQRDRLRRFDVRAPVLVPMHGIAPAHVGENCIAAVVSEIEAAGLIEPAQPGQRAA
jgi:hypothetical protein